MCALMTTPTLWKCQLARLMHGTHHYPFTLVSFNLLCAQAVRKASKAAYGLCSWVRAMEAYDRFVVESVAP